MSQISGLKNTIPLLHIFGTRYGPELSSVAISTEITLQKIKLKPPQRIVPKPVETLQIHCDAI